jgi:hypothetical protein
MLHSILSSKRPFSADGYDADAIDDEELVLVACHHALKKRRLREQMARTFCVASKLMLDAYVKYRGGMNAILNFQLEDVPPIRFESIEAYCEKRFIQDFRFSKRQFNLVIEALISDAGFPTQIVSYAGDKAPLSIAFLMLCMKYAWPTRLGTMSFMFGKSISYLSRIIKAMRVLLFQFCHSKMRNPPQLADADLKKFTEAIKKKSGFDICFGFLDATIRPTCKPSIGQKEYYNGKDRLHAIKFQICNTPDGIIQHIDGPWPGRRNDHHMVNSAPLSSGSPALVSWILSHPCTDRQTHHVVYADQGYFSQVGIETPWPDADFNIEHEHFNACMCTARISVEWEFGHILEHWASLHYIAVDTAVDAHSCESSQFATNLGFTVDSCCHHVRSLRHSHS